MRRAGIGIGDGSRAQRRGLTIKPIKGAGEESKAAAEVDVGGLVVVEGGVSEIFKVHYFPLFSLRCTDRRV
jgi:hypothetical protein